MITTVFEGENVEFKYDSERQELYQRWDGYIKSEVFKRAMDAVVKLSEQHAIKYIISDTSTHESLSQEDLEHAAKMTPQLFENGIKYIAFIVSKSPMGRLSANQFTTMVREEMGIGHFDNIDGARRWIDHNLI